MNDVFKDFLESHIKLNYTKTVVEKNKKIISTCIFLPENPSISIKTPVYILGMIKLVETFNEYMSDGKWILRIYYDSMFDKGIKLKKLDKVVKEEEKEARNESPNNNNTTSLYEYEYNTMILNPQNNPKTRTLKENINANKIYLKKLIKLTNLYFEEIRTSRDKRYERVELVSYDCQSASNYPDIIGHPATFGSIMRFMALYDEDVDKVFCINSRYAMTPLQKIMIDNWDSNDKHKMLTMMYSARHFMPRVTNTNLHEKAYEIINKIKVSKEKLKPIEELFVETINSIYEFKESIFKTGKVRRFEEQSQVKERNAYKLLLGITIYDDDYNAKFLLNDSIGAGFFGIKKDCPYFNDRIVLFAKLLKYYIISKNDFKFGIDELLLKVTIAFEDGISGVDKKNTIQFLDKIIKLPSRYIKNTYLDEYLYNIRGLLDDKSFLETHDGKKIVIKKKLKDGFEFHSYLWRDDTVDIGILNTRSLYEVIDGTQLEESDKILKIIHKNNDIISVDFYVLFTSFDEEKKLFLIDSSLSRDFLKYVFNASLEFGGKEKYGSLFTVLDLNDYKSRDINKLLYTIISYYRQIFNPNIIKFIDGLDKINNSNDSNNETVALGKKKLKTKKKNKSRKIRKASKHKK